MAWLHWPRGLAALLTWSTFSCSTGLMVWPALRQVLYHIQFGPHTDLGHARLVCAEARDDVKSVRLASMARAILLA